MTLVAALVAAAISQPQPSGPINVPAGPTLASVNRVAAAVGVDVVVAADLRNRRSPAVSGASDAEAAFDRLLRPAGARAVRLADGLYRIEPVARRPVPPPEGEPEPAPTVIDEVIVTASAPRGGLDGANGRFTVPEAALEELRGVVGSEAVSDLVATVDSTRQGAGRNKLFIRGVADSAFNGPLQATVGQYLGDLRLNYGAPDPDLFLIDMQRIEIFEGPQSSRFGAGSIGGVVRMHARPASLQEQELEIAGGLSMTPGGGLGGDLSLVANQPIGETAAVRLVVYDGREGGFLKNPVRGVENEDAVDTAGVRLAARLLYGGWTIDGLFLTQKISSADAQTVAVEEVDPVKRKLMAEPYESTLQLAGVTAHRRSGASRVTLSAGLSKQVLDESFDATEPGSATPVLAARRQKVSALSVEARLEWDDAGFWSFNGGGALAVGRTEAVRFRRNFVPEALASGDAQERDFAEGALFGEAVAAVSSTLDVAFGGRLSIAHGVHGSQIFGGGTLLSSEDVRREEAFFSPTAAVRWTPEGGPTVFLRFERGVRPGSVSEGGGRLERHRADRVALFEAGLRTGRTSSWTAEASIGWLDWRDVQADVITPDGDLAVRNVGDGLVRFVQAKAAWSPSAALDLSGSLFLNDSRLTPYEPNANGVRGGDIPNVARSGAQFSAAYDLGAIAGWPAGLSADLRYIGESRPGLGPGLDVIQGGYWRADLQARWGDERGAVVLRISNPMDEWAIRYGVGSPYQLNLPQGAPLRPLTLRLGFEASF
ncbi:TonB-dependent Receptor Plug Domain protein [compost metagenome]